jgi:signal transduction histidine kinase
MDGSGRASRRRLRPSTLVTAGALVAITAGATFGTRSVVHDQEDRLLKERGAEVSLILTTAFGSLQSTLASIGTATKVSGDRAANFGKVATPQLALSEALTGIALLRPTGAGFTVALAAGPQFRVGEVLSGARAETLRAALHTPKFLSTPVLTTAGTRALGFALGPPFTAPGTVLYEESRVETTSRPPTTDTTAFSDIYVTLFTSSRPSPDQLIISTAPGQRIPAGSRYVRTPVGASTWTVGLVARHRLVGSVAAWAQWFVLGAGLLGALLVAAVVDVVLRRRDYALELVADRTAELRESLTQLENAQLQLVRGERLAAVGQLASTVGHELRNPLGVISNALYLIRMSVGPDPDVRQERYLAIAEREVGAATLIVSDLLEYARGRAPIVGPVDLPALIDEAIEVAPPVTGVNLTWPRPQDLPTVAADRDQLRQVLLNVINNAYDAMPDGGELAIGCGVRDGHVDLIITDTGMGMDEATRARLFEPFFTTKARGVGLGMAVTEQVVLAHHGAITVDSAPGVGTTFVVSLPTGAVPTPAVPTPAVPTGAVPTGAVG